MLYSVKNILLLMVVSTLSLVCSKNQQEDIVPKEPVIEKAEQHILDANNQMGFKSFNYLSRTKAENENLIISPINSTLSFNLLLNAADGNTKKIVKQHLGIMHLGDSNITIGFDNLEQLFAQRFGQSHFESVNTLATYSQDDIQTNFKRFVEKRSSLQIVQDENSGFVKEFAESSSLNKNAFQLINSIDFSSNITHQKSINELPFYKTPDESGFVNMIAASSEFNYYADITVEVVELPLGQENYNMMVILPQGSQSLNDLAFKLNTRLFSRIKDKLKLRRLEVYLPMLEISGVESLKNTLNRSRLQSCFRQNSANFSKLSKNSSLFLSDVEQVTSFSLGAAKSDNNVVDQPMEGYSSLLIDRPFLFVVYEKSTDAVVFIGKISQP